MTAYLIGHLARSLEEEEEEEDEGKDAIYYIRISKETPTMKLIIQALLGFISTLTQKTPSARNAKGQPVKVKRINDI